LLEAGCAIPNRLNDRLFGNAFAVTNHFVIHLFAVNLETVLIQRQELLK